MPAACEANRDGARIEEQQRNCSDGCGALPCRNDEPERDGGFFAAYSQDWTFIEEGAKAPVSFLFELPFAQGPITR